MGWIAALLKWLLGLWLEAPAGPSPEARQAAAGAAATVHAQEENNAVVEIKTAAAAADAAAAQQLRGAGTGPTTSDPDAAINQVDAADRRD